MASANPVSGDKPRARDIERLRERVPLRTLTDELFAELLDDVTVQTLDKGTVLFEEGDTDHVSVYLLKGRLSLFKGGRVVERLEAGEERSRFPVAHILPRQLGARAASRVRVARVDSRRVSELLARAERSDYHVDEFQAVDTDDWMSLLLRSPILQQLPPANIQRVMMSVERVEVLEGESVIRQGDPGDYFYMLVQGQAVVCRQEGQGASRELARLGPGDAFGEEALISDSPRNASVTMLSDGQVLRLSKTDFLELVQSPLARRLDIDQARALVAQGAVWIDLRSPEDHERDAFPGSINLPVESLRYQLDSLAPDRHYVLYSNSGGRAEVGAYLMAQQGFEVSVLEGGVRWLQEGTISSVEGSEDDAAVRRQSIAGETVREEAGATERLMEGSRENEDLALRLREAESQLAALERDSAAERQAAELRLQELERRLQEGGQRQDVLERERDQALERIESLESDLIRLREERDGLARRLAEQERRERRLQIRIEKLERERIRDRERAESASEALEGMTEQLAALKQEREQERRRQDQEVGGLKERLTELQMELDQAHQELSELRADRAQVEAGEGGADRQIEQLRLDLVQREAELERAGRALKEAENEAQQLQEALAEARQALEEREMHVGSLKAELAVREKEVGELRAVVERHVEQITVAEKEYEEHLEAMQREMEVLREESSREITQLRQQLEAAWVTRDGQASPEHVDATTLEAMRQALHDAQRALAGRQRDIEMAEESRQLLEDALEDANAEIERLRREIERLVGDSKESLFKTE